MNRLHRRLASSEGFTLIELLVVIVIIGILLAIAIPSYLGFRKQAQDTAGKANVREAVPSAESFYATNSTYVGHDDDRPQGDRQRPLADRHGRVRERVDLLPEGCGPGERDLVLRRPRRDGHVHSADRLLSAPGRSSFTRSGGPLARRFLFSGTHSSDPPRWVTRCASESPVVG